MQPAATLTSPENSARDPSEGGQARGLAESDGSNVPRGAVSTFVPRVRASRHESAICFESHELDPALVLWPPRRRRATNRVAQREAVAKGRDWGCICLPEFACDGEPSSVRCFPAPFWLPPRFSGVRLLDPARILCPPRRRPATNRVAPREDVTHRRVSECICEPEFAASRRAARRGVFSSGIRCLGTPLLAVDQ